MPSSVPTLLYPPKPIPLPLSFVSFFFSSPPFPLIFLIFIPPFLFVLSFSFFLSWSPLFFKFNFGFFYFFLLFSSNLSTFCVCVCVCVCVSRMYVRAYLAIPCVSADDNVKHTKSNIRYDNKINKMKQMWNILEFMYMSTQNGCLPATFLIETESRNT